MGELLNGSRSANSRGVKIPGLWLVDSSGAIKIFQEDILYCHHERDVTNIYFTCGRYTTTTVPLKRIEGRLCRKRFFRCHRNYIINLTYASEASNIDNTLSLFKRVSVPVSRRKKPQLLTMLESNSGDQNRSA